MEEEEEEIEARLFRGKGKRGAGSSSVVVVSGLRPPMPPLSSPLFSPNILLFP